MTAVTLPTSTELEGATGRAYLRAAVGLLEHAVVVLAHVTDEEREPVPDLLDRAEYAAGLIRARQTPMAPQPAEPVQDGTLW